MPLSLSLSLSLSFFLSLSHSFFLPLSLSFSRVFACLHAYCLCSFFTTDRHRNGKTAKYIRKNGSGKEGTKEQLVKQRRGMVCKKQASFVSMPMLLIERAPTLCTKENINYRIAVNVCSSFYDDFGFDVGLKKRPLANKLANSFCPR